MIDVPVQLIEDSKKTKRKIKLKAYVDWNNDNAYSPSEEISDYILSATIDKKLEGKIGIPVVDRATLTLSNASGDFSPKNINSKWTEEENENIIMNVLPTRKAKIEATVGDNELQTLFEGYITAINPNFDNSRVSITIDDPINILQKTDCPDKFYHNQSPEDIIKEWLDEVNINYTDNTIDSTLYLITENFAGNKMWEAIQEITQSVWGSSYISNGTFYFKTDLSPDYEFSEPVDEFWTYDDENKENVFKIQEQYSSNNLYNEVEVVSNPLKLQGEQILWSGAESESQVNEQYKGLDLVGDTLQLTHVPSGQTEKENTKNVPLIPGSIGITNMRTGMFYTEQNGGISTVDYDEGLITFINNQDFPKPEENDNLKIVYRYFFNRIVPNKYREFLVDLEHPAIDISNITDYLKAENIDGNDITESLSVEQEVFENNQRVKIKIINNNAEKAYLFSELYGKVKPDLVLTGRPFIRDEEYRIIEVDQDSIDAYDVKNRLTIQNNLINSEQTLRQMAKYLLWNYSTPKSGIRAETKGMFHLELGDKVTLKQKGRDVDEDYIIKGIKDKFLESGKWNWDLILEQANPSAWSYQEDGAPTLIGKKPVDRERLIEPPQVTGLNTSLISASIAGNNRVLLTWNKSNFNNASHYNIYRREDSESSFSFLKDVHRNTTNYFDSSIIYNERYYYKISLVDNNGNESDLSDSIPISGLLIRMDGAPSIPLFNFNKSYFREEIYLDWEHIEEVTKYEKAIEYELRTNTNFGSEVGRIYIGSKTEFTFTNPSTREYTFYIKAIDENGLYSNDYDSITLNNPAPPKPNLPVVQSFYESLFIIPQSVIDDDLKGYFVYIKDTDTDIEEIIDIATPQKINYKAGKAKNFDIQVSAYDSLGEGESSYPPVNASTGGIEINESDLDQELQGRISNWDGTYEIVDENAIDWDNAVVEVFPDGTGQASSITQNANKIDQTVAKLEFVEEIAGSDSITTLVADANNDTELTVAPLTLDIKAGDLLYVLNNDNGTMQTIQVEVAQDADENDNSIIITNPINANSDSGIHFSNKMTISQVRQLANQFTVKIDQNGKVVGFGLAIDEEGQGEISFVADEFKLIDPNEQGVYPFVVKDGNVYIDEAHIEKISANQIKSGTLTLTEGMQIVNDGEQSVLFDKDGLEINTDNFSLTKDGLMNVQNAEVEGIIKAGAIIETGTGSGVQGVFKSSSIIIAANDSSQAGKNGADYACNGENDEEQVNEAILKLIDIVHQGTSPSPIYTGGNTIELDSHASSEDGFYVGMWLKLKNTDFIYGKTFKIIAYDGTTKVATVDGTWSNGVPGGDYYIFQGNGGKITFLEGNYFLDNPISMWDFITLEGQDSTIFNVKGDIGIHLENDLIPSDIKIRNIRFITDLPDKDAIRYSESNRLEIEECVFSNFNIGISRESTYEAFAGSSASVWRIENCVFENCDVGLDLEASNSMVTKNSFVNCDRGIVASNRSTIFNNTFLDYTTNGIYVIGNNAKINQNIFRSSLADYAISIPLQFGLPSFNTRISNNDFEDGYQIRPVFDEGEQTTFHSGNAENKGFLGKSDFDVHYGSRVKVASAGTINVPCQTWATIFSKNSPVRVLSGIGIHKDKTSRLIGLKVVVDGQEQFSFTGSHKAVTIPPIYAAESLIIQLRNQSGSSREMSYTIYYKDE